MPNTTMSNWPTWTTDEEIVLVYFLSCGICKAGVRELIAYKCNKTRRVEQDIKHHVFRLHYESKSDRWNGSGPLLVPQAEAPRSHAAVPDVWSIDWKDSWKEQNVDDWLIKKASRNYHLNDLTVIGVGGVEIVLICEEQEPDEIDYTWVKHRQAQLVEKHRRIYGNPA